MSAVRCYDSIPAGASPPQVLELLATFSIRLLAGCFCCANWEDPVPGFGKPRRDEAHAARRRALFADYARQEDLILSFEHHVVEVWRHGTGGSPGRWVKSHMRVLRLRLRYAGDPPAGLRLLESP